MLKTNSHDWLLKEANDVSFQSAVENQNSLIAHINYGYISSTNSLLRSSLEDCCGVLTPTLPHGYHDDAGQVHLRHDMFDSIAHAKAVDCSQNIRKRKRIPNAEICKRPRSLYDQATFDHEKENIRPILAKVGSDGSPLELRTDEAYWTDDELDKAIAIEVFDTKKNENQFDKGLETRVGENFKAFHRYIENCVKPVDMIAFFDKFSFEQRKLLHQTIPKNTIKANRQIFQVITAMDDTPDKYTSLLNACKEGGYPKVAEILLGRLVPKNKKHRQAISKAAKHIYQRLSVCDVTPYLLNKGVINRLDVEEVKASEARCEAALELLLLLPNRSRQWFGSFIEALMESNQCDLAELIDKKMTKEIRGGTYIRSLQSTSLESVNLSTLQTPQTKSVPVTSTKEPVTLTDFAQMETVLEEPDNMVESFQDCNNHADKQSNIFGRFRKSFKKTYYSVIGKRLVYNINE